MHSISVCCSCGRTIEKKFLYCPSCGTAVGVLNENSKCSKYDNAVYQQVRYVSPDIRSQRICRMEFSLDQLEEDLSRIISQSGC